MNTNELRDPNKLREYLIDELLPQSIPFKTEKVIDDQGLSYLQGVDNDIKILPLLNISGNVVVNLSFNIFFGNEMGGVFKPCEGKGADSLSALRMALDTARIALLPALKRLMENDVYASGECDLGGKKHSWKVYAGNVCTIKDNIVSESQGEVAEILDQVLPDVIKRLGNQKRTGVFFGLSAEDGCLFTINSYRVTEITDKLKEIANGFPGATKEISLIIVQDESTYLQSSTDDLQRNFSMLNEYVDMLRNTPGRVLSESDLEDAKLLLGDPTFVECCKAFLPELLAWTMTPSDIRYSDQVEIYTADGEKHDVYLSQLSDFRNMQFDVYRLCSQAQRNGDDALLRGISQRSQTINYILENQIPITNKINIEDYRLKFYMGEGFEFR